MTVEELRNTLARLPDDALVFALDDRRALVEVTSTVVSQVHLWHDDRTETSKWLPMDPTGVQHGKLAVVLRTD